MSWKIIEYMDENPQASNVDVLHQVAEELEVDEQLQYVHDEVDKVLEIRERLRPLYAEKSDKDTELAIIDSEFDTQVMVKYPPRKGSEKDRKLYKQELQANHSGHQKLSQQSNGLKEEIAVWEEKMDDVMQRAKNARRLIETFNHFMAFLVGSTKPQQNHAKSYESNHNTF